MTGKKKNAMKFPGVGCAVLFGLPFAACSMFMAWSLASLLMLASAASNWVETPATITHLELERGETQKVIGNYQYVYLGQQYTSDRIALSTEADNISKFHNELYQRLKKRFDANQPVTCYVNPSDPGTALLDRSLRPKLVVFHIPFILAFGLAGFGIVISAIVMNRIQRKRDAKFKEFPDEPWKVRDDWAAGEVVSMRWRPLIVLIAFALFWNSIAFPISFLFFNDEDAPGWVSILVLLFPLVGLFLIGGTAFEAMRVFRYGKSILRLAAVPGVVGGELTGVVVVPEHLRIQGPYQVALACIRQQTHHRGGESETKSVTLWEDSRLIDETLSDKGGQQGVPVRFIIPSGEKPTDSKDDQPVTWKLTLEAKVFGPDYKAEFEVPVFVTADSQEGIQTTHETLTEFELEETLAQQLARDNLIADKPSESSLRITCPPMRHIGTVIGFFLTGIIFAGIGIGFLWLGAGFDRYIFGVVFTLVGGGVILGGIGTLLSSSELIINGKQWRLKSGWYGFRGAGREFSAKEIKYIGLKNSMLSNSGNNLKQWNSVIAKLNDGPRLKLVRGLSDRRTERRLIYELKQLAGLSVDTKEVDALED